MKMTIDELDTKICMRFDQLDDKLDNINLIVARHTVSLQGHDRELGEVKKNAKDDKEKLEMRISRLERWMWFSLGAGGAAGAGLAKLFT